MDTTILQSIIHPKTGDVLFYETLFRPEGISGPDIQKHFDQMENNGRVKLFNVFQVGHILDVLKANPDLKKASVNVSMQTLCNPAALSDILNRLSQSPDEAQRLIIEVTEKHKPEYNMGVVAAAIRQLHKKGCEIALDDVKLRGDPRAKLFKMPEVKCLKIEKLNMDRLDIDKPQYSPRYFNAIATWVSAHQSQGKMVILEQVQLPEHEKIVSKLEVKGVQVGTGERCVHLNLSTGPWPNKPPSMGQGRGGIPMQVIPA